jgi:hypothetical protein
VNAQDAIEKAAARAQANRQALAIDTDSERILGLPTMRVVMPPSETSDVKTPTLPESIEIDLEIDAAAEAERWTRALRKHPNAPPLRPIQGATLTMLARSALKNEPHGAFCPIPVGAGKSLIFLLAPTVTGAQRPLGLIPPSMRDQLRLDIARWQQHYHFVPPKYLAYSELSMASATSTLEWMQPDLLICDEAHALRNRSSARVKRVLRLLKEHPECRVVLLSGTITGKSLLDHAHLLEICLRDRTPLPLHFKTLEQWSSVLDPDGEPDYDSIRAMWPLAERYGDQPADFSKIPREVRQRIARDAYRMRFMSVPGVIASAESSVGCSLYLARRRPHVPAVVQDALKLLFEKNQLPDTDGVGGEKGEELVDATAIARAAGYLSAGFYYRWDWSWGGRRPIDYESGSAKDEYDRDWMARRRNWAKAVRDTLKHGSRAGLDSEFLVKMHAARGKGGGELQQAYGQWHETRPEDDTVEGVSKHGERRWCDREPPPILPVWVSEFLLDDVEKWVEAERKASRGKESVEGNAKGKSVKAAAQDNSLGRALLWYSSRAMEEGLARRGFRTFGAGSQSPDDRETYPACSILVHGKGKNLQGERDRGPGLPDTLGWSRMLVIEPPSSGQVWEQLVGRVHRQGQLADEVVVVIYQHTAKLLESIATATGQAKYIQQTQGVQQKLLYGTWTNEER